MRFLFLFFLLSTVVVLSIDGRIQRRRLSSIDSGNPAAVAASEADPDVIFQTGSPDTTLVDPITEPVQPTPTTSPSTDSPPTGNVDSNSNNGHFPSVAPSSSSSASFHGSNSDGEITVEGTGQAEIQTEKIRLTMRIQSRQYAAGFNPSHPIYTMQSASAVKPLVVNTVQAGIDAVKNSLDTSPAVVESMKASLSRFDTELRNWIDQPSSTSSQEAAESLSNIWSQLKDDMKFDVDAAAVSKSAVAPSLPSTQPMVINATQEPSAPSSASGFAALTKPTSEQLQLIRRELQSNIESQSTSFINRMTNVHATVEEKNAITFEPIVNYQCDPSVKDSSALGTDATLGCVYSPWTIGYNAFQRMVLTTTNQTQQADLEDLLASSASSSTTNGDSSIYIDSSTPISSVDSLLRGEIRATRRAIYEASRKATAIAKAISQLNEENDYEDDEDGHNRGLNNKGLWNRPFNGPAESDFGVENRFQFQLELVRTRCRTVNQALPLPYPHFASSR